MTVYAASTGITVMGWAAAAFFSAATLLVVVVIKVMLSDDDSDDDKPTPTGPDPHEPESTSS